MRQMSRNMQKAHLKYNSGKAGHVSFLRLFFYLNLLSTLASLAFLNPDISSLCSGLPEPREVNVSLLRQGRGPSPPGLPSRLGTTGFLWTLRVWRSVITFPKGNLQAEGAHGTLNFTRGHDSHSPVCYVCIHRGAGARRTPHCPAAYGGAVPTPRRDALPRGPRSTAALPGGPELNASLLFPDSHTGVCIHCHGYPYFLCFWFFF